MVIFRIYFYNFSMCSCYGWELAVTSMCRLASWRRFRKSHSCGFSFAGCLNVIFSELLRFNWHCAKTPSRKAVKINVNRHSSLRPPPFPPQFPSQLVGTFSMKMLERQQEQHCGIPDKRCAFGFVAWKSQRNYTKVMQPSCRQSNTHVHTGGVKELALKI